MATEGWNSLQICQAFRSSYFRGGILAFLGNGDDADFLLVRLEHQPDTGQSAFFCVVTNDRPHLLKQSLDLAAGEGIAFKTVDVMGGSQGLEVVRAGDLDRARAEIRVRVFVGDDRDQAAVFLGADRNFDQLADDGA